MLKTLCTKLCKTHKSGFLRFLGVNLNDIEKISADSESGQKNTYLGCSVSFVTKEKKVKDKIYFKILFNKMFKVVPLIINTKLHPLKPLLEGL